MASGGYEATMLDHDAAVHRYVDAARFGAGGGFLMDDSLLDPQVGKVELEHLVDDGRDKLRQAEDVDDVGFDGKLGEACVRFFAEDFWDGGGDGVDLVDALLHVLGNVVSRRGGGRGGGQE